MTKSISLAVLGIVAVLAIVGLVLLFTSAKATGQVGAAYQPYGTQFGQAGGYDPTTQYYDNELGGVPYRQDFGDKNFQPRYYSEGQPQRTLR